jgi:hypothetical protein
MKFVAPKRVPLVVEAVDDLVLAPKMEYNRYLLWLEKSSNQLWFQM